MIRMVLSNSNWCLTNLKMVEFNRHLLDLEMVEFDDGDAEVDANSKVI